MSTDRFTPEPTDFTPQPGDADLAADPATGTGPGGLPLGDDAPAGDVDATAGGDSRADASGQDVVPDAAAPEPPD